MLGSQGWQKILHEEDTTTDVVADHDTANENLRMYSVTVRLYLMTGMNGCRMTDYTTCTSYM